MNKETRQFIFGIIIATIGIIALASDIIDIKANTFSGWDYVFIIVHALLAYIGASLINKTIR